MSEEKKGGITVFGHPAKDCVILFTMFASIAAGGIVVGGTPGQTRDAIDSQTRTLSEDLRLIRSAIERNTRRIDSLDEYSEEMSARMDSLHQTMIEGYRNLDGYFRGRLDQLRSIENN
jgi:hypothetical protein